MKYATKYFDNSGCEAQQDGSRNYPVGGLVCVGVGEKSHQGGWDDVEFGNCSVDGVNETRDQARIQSILKQTNNVS